MIGPAENLRKESGSEPEQVPASAVPVAKESWLHERYQAADLRAVLKLIVAEKRTGQLTLHFGQGAVSIVEWREKDRRQNLKNEN